MRPKCDPAGGDEPRSVAQGDHFRLQAQAWKLQSDPGRAFPVETIGSLSLPQQPHSFRRSDSSLEATGNLEAFDTVHLIGLAIESVDFFSIY